MKQYDVILADAPWNHTAFSDGNPLNINGRGRSRHYPRMTVEELCQMKIPSRKNSALFMWAIWPEMPGALRVIEAWGFEYKTVAWVWIKANPTGYGFFTGLGAYTRANSEPCLLAIKGSMPVKAHDIQSLIYSAVMEHSRKPDDQYRKIEALYPNMDYLELFARRERPGWDVFGNQVANSITLPVTDMIP